MDLKAYQYMNEYLKERFPIYYKYLEKTLFHSNILSSVYQEYGTMAICHGDADDTLDGLLDDYMKCNHRDIWMSYNNLHSYIKKLILAKSNILMYKSQHKILDFVINKIVLEIIADRDIDKVEYLNGSYDEKIINQFKEYVNALYSKLCSHIDDILKYSDIKIKCNKASYNYLRNMTIEQLLQEKRIDEVISGTLDDLIVERYKKNEIIVKNKVKEHIEKVITESTFPFGIPEKQLITLLNRKIFESGELSVSKVLNGEYNSYIINYGNRLKNEKDCQRAQAHIDKVIIRNVFTSDLTEQEILQYSSEIFQSLVQEYDCTLIGISTGRCDDLILKLFNRKLMKKASVVDKSKPKKIKHDTVKKKINSVLRKLVIIAIISCIVTGTIYATRTTIDTVQYNMAYNDMVDFDRYNYNFIYAVDNDRVEPTGQNTLNFYRKVKSAGIDENLYGYLAFYSTYVNVRQDRLYIMDQIMREAKWYAKDDEYCADFYNELSNCHCFLEFAMNRLFDMGCVEIKEDKYMEALEAYKSAMASSNVEKPMNEISSENVKIIEEIMEMYRKYCKDLVVEFSQQLDADFDNNYDNPQTLENSKFRRNI